MRLPVCHLVVAVLLLSGCLGLARRTTLELTYADHLAFASRKDGHWVVNQIMTIGDTSAERYKAIRPVPIDLYKKQHGEPLKQEKKGEFDWR